MVSSVLPSVALTTGVGDVTRRSMRTAVGIIQGSGSYGKFRVRQLQGQASNSLLSEATVSAFQNSISETEHIGTSMDIHIKFIFHQS